MYNAICQGVVANQIDEKSLMGETTEEFSKFNELMVECLKEMGVLEPEVFGAGMKVQEDVTTDVSRFLNRILGLKIEPQNMIFNYFCKCLDAHVAMAKNEGRYNEGLVDITASSVEMVRTPRVIFKEKRGSANNPTKHIVLNVDRGMAWDKAVNRLNNHPHEKNSFFRSHREIRGQRFYLLATLKENSKHMYRIARPNTGLSSFEEEEGDLLAKYEAVDKEKAEKGWKKQFEHAQSHCIHGPACKTGPTCTVGARCYKIHLLTGGIVTMMSLLESCVLKFSGKLGLTKAEMLLRVVRVKLNSGERLVGIRVPELIIPLAQKELTEQIAVEDFLFRQQKLTAMGITSSQLSQADPLSSLASSSSSAAATIDDINSTDRTVNRLATVEEVNPVNPKLLTKATTPPVTIKNFFKPKERNLNSITGSDVIETKFNTGNDAISEVNSKTGSDESSSKYFKSGNCVISNGDDLSDTENSKDCNIHKFNISQSKQDDTNGNKETLMNNVTTCQNKEQIAKSSSNESLSSVSKNDPKSKVLSESNGKKRTSLFDNVRPLKKSKQCNIMSSFARQKTIHTVKEEKGLTCPICSVKFESGTLNSKINEHIDNCLIE